LRQGCVGGKIGPDQRKGKHMRRIVFLAVCFGLVTAPALAQTKATMQKLDDDFAHAFNTGNPAAVGEMYAPDAYLLPPGAPMVHGRAAIEQFWKGLIPTLQDIQCTALDVKRLGGRAAREIGTCSAMTKKAPLKEINIKYAVVWQKEGGRWQLIQDIWNAEK
jgi:uncharacterized protein (TIGR02246 family)